MPYREGFVKNRYVGRTFIMPGQAMRKKSVRQKLNTVGQEFKGKHVLLVDDSIVRGTTSREIVEMAREAGATKVYFASAAPPVRYPNVYGIDMPTRAELIATGRTDDGIAREIGADALIYQDLEALEAVDNQHPCRPDGFDASCFDGCYITGDVDEYYLDAVEGNRGGKARQTTTMATARRHSSWCCNWPRKGATDVRRSRITARKRWPCAPARSAASSASTPKRCT